MPIKSQYILDTNCYITFFTKRNLEQFEACYEVFQRLEKSEVSIFLPDIVVAEIVYVLTDCYNLSRAEIANFLYPLCKASGVLMYDKQTMVSALGFFETGNLDFADCFLLALTKNLNNSKLLTFDKKLIKENQKL